MKFSVKSIFPIFTSILCPTNCRASWESAAMEVEYLFMGDGSRNYGQITEGNYDFRHLSISGLIAKPQLDEESGGYRQRNAVPI
ncbi:MULTISPECIES: hypothetical protein [unclassified Nostoc]|uniref:hypothetical protein n=1 Tax=unclassified Nostoc TaxID=2593658 RepID=UPI000DECAC85|nr:MULTISPECIES: hypothetical protein [unclassified Nostoc]MBD2505818.1 hypothetical protein [Desmonostoc muscorum FACHB-395]QLE51519.1 hypothetical protein FD724_27950 [Nostoc sp. C057]RCJ22895.1 hypothetical protein A6V25_22925 [Nostoc sp. ATCC 53789]